MKLNTGHSRKPFEEKGKTNPSPLAQQKLEELGKMKKKILTLALALVLLVALVIPVSVALAAEDTVVCSVTGKLIAVSVTDGVVDYGVVALDTTQDTMTVTDTQTATNTGTVDIDLEIKSSNATGGVAYVLGASRGADTFTHEASIDGFTTPIAMTTVDTYVPLATDVVTTQTFDLRIGMPTSVTDYDAKTITVTIQATEATP